MLSGAGCCAIGGKRLKAKKEKTKEVEENILITLHEIKTIEKYIAELRVELKEASKILRLFSQIFNKKMRRSLIALRTVLLNHQTESANRSSHRDEENNFS